MQELTRNKRGLESDKLLFEIIKDYPGLSQYELTKKLEWESGRVDGAIRRLLNENLILIKSIERNGRLVNLVYLKDNKPSNIIEVPENLLQFGNSTWLDSAFVYALDSTTIGIAGHEMPEWNEISCFIEKIPITKDKKKKLLCRFQKNSADSMTLVGRHKVASVNGNTILITIAGSIVEEKKYPVLIKRSTKSQIRKKCGCYAFSIFSHLLKSSRTSSPP